MIRGAALLALLLAQVPVADAAGGPHPLLEFARERALHDDDATNLVGDDAVREAEHQLAQAQAPPDAQCAGSLGAMRYAELHARAGSARSALGDFTGAAAAFRRAQACRPRDASITAALADELFDARDLAGARLAVDAALDIDRRSLNANRLAGNLDFVQGRWADAIARFRYVAASDEDRTTAAYAQLMYWLAQRRAGIENPQAVARTPNEGWPQPLLLYLRGQYTEAELIMPIKAGDDEDNTQPNTSTRERLCEALFYLGEDYLARGERDVAREYFAALVNLKVIYFVEHGVALNEIAALR